MRSILVSDAVIGGGKDIFLTCERKRDKVQPSRRKKYFLFKAWSAEAFTRKPEMDGGCSWLILLRALLVVLRELVVVIAARELVLYGNAVERS